MAVFFKENDLTYDPANFTKRLDACINKWEDNDDLDKANDATW
jgi:hypothetical protein